MALSSAIERERLLIKYTPYTIHTGCNSLRWKAILGVSYKASDLSFWILMAGLTRSTLRDNIDMLLILQLNILTGTCLNKRQIKCMPSI
jgi:hypothetical protein